MNTKTILIRILRICAGKTRLKAMILRSQSKHIPLKQNLHRTPKRNLPKDRLLNNLKNMMQFRLKSRIKTRQKLRRGMRMRPHLSRLFRMLLKMRLFWKNCLKKKQNSRSRKSLFPICSRVLIKYPISFRRMNPRTAKIRAKQSLKQRNMHSLKHRTKQIMRLPKVPTRKPGRKSMQKTILMSTVLLAQTKNRLTFRNPKKPIPLRRFPILLWLCRAITKSKAAELKSCEKSSPRFLQSALLFCLQSAFLT